MTLPVQPDWYTTHQIDDRIWQITEPHVHPIYSANIYMVLGRDADLVVDSGMGVAPLKPVVDGLRPDTSKPLILFTTHAHVDHIGGAHEFDTRLVHPLEAPELATPTPYSLDTSGISEAFRKIFLDAGYDPLWPLLIDAVPWAEYDPSAYALHPAPATEIVTEGGTVDLGDWVAEIMHLPGHSPGQIGLFHADSGTLFSADAIYDGPLLYEGEGTSIPDYVETFKRLRKLPVKRVFGGHEPGIGGDRMDEIIDTYLRRWA